MKKKSIIMPVFVPQIEVEHAEKIKKKTEKANRWWKAKLCACGCEGITYATYVNGHNLKRIAKKARFMRMKLKNRRWTGAEIRESRQESGYSQQELCLLLNIKTNSQPRISRWESDILIPSKAREELLMKVLPFLPRR